MFVAKAPGAKRRLPRLSPLRLYVAAFLLFVGATIAVGVGQFSAGSNVAPLTSIGLSAGAVGLTIVALATRSGR